MGDEDVYMLPDWDWEPYVGKETPYSLRHFDGSAQVVFVNDDEGRPIRVLGFLLDKYEAQSLTDQEILMMGLEKQRQIDIWLTTNKNNKHEAEKKS